MAPYVLRARVPSPGPRFLGPLRYTPPVPRPAAALIAAVLLAAACRPTPAPAPFVVTPALVAANNRGVGLMGQFDFPAAAEAFGALASQYPDWPEARFNLAVARMNRQADGDSAAAEPLLRALVDTPSLARRARYTLGLLLIHEGREAEALPLLTDVADDEPGDGYAAYFAGQLRLAGSPAEALAWYERAARQAPLLRSAHYGAFLALQRLGRAGEGAPRLERFQALATNPQATVAEFKYTRMGPLAEAMAVDAPAALEQARTPSPGARQPGVNRFLPPAALPGVESARWRRPAGPVSVTVADIDGNGQADLFIPGIGPGETRNAVLLRRDGRYEAATTHPLAAVASVRAALWGDLDDDGLLDVVLLRPAGGTMLWRQAPAGAWTNITATARVRLGRFDAVDGALFDADHDGDLDIFLVNAAGPNELLNNDGNGRFRAVGTDTGLAGDSRPSRGLALADLDGDRDTDVVVIKQSPPHDVFLNDRVWQYRRDGAASRLADTPMAALLPADLDADGAAELYTLGPAGLARWMRDEAGAWRAADLLRASSSAIDARLAVADTVGDGHLGLLWSLDSAVSELDPRNPNPGSGQPLSGTPAPAGWTILSGGGGAPALVTVSDEGVPQLRAPAAGRRPYASLTFTGRDPKSDQRRSNVSGVGARIGVRTGSRWTAFDTTRLQTGPGQSAQPFDVGLGDAARADFVAITWSDGVFQTELALDAGRVHRIAETQRQLSSCPVVFAWDGQAYRFVTDVLGVGGIGFFERPGVYSPPWPREDVLLPAGALAPRDGRYELKIAEPMEEITYLDSAALVAYDLPPGWQMAIDERKAITGPAPTGDPIYFREERLPARATTSDGVDVTAALRDVDLEAAGPGHVDPRFIGRAERHAVTLAFGRPLDDHGGRPVLIADGWIEYPYAQTVFAAWQAGAPYEAPTLEARSGNGRWQAVAAEFGYPAGMPRRMALPLPPLPRGTTALRISTTQEIYWDRLSVAYGEDLPEARRSVLPLASARLAASGFARRATGPQRAPSYDYEARTPLADTRHPRGWYTAFGDIDPLVEATDDAVAIIGPGEEAHLEFIAPPPPLAGWTRRLVLQARGWCKDMDLYTKDGETVAPLPGRDTPQRQALHARFNTRYMAGY